MKIFSFIGFINTQYDADGNIVDQCAGVDELYSTLKEAADALNLDYERLIDPNVVPDRIGKKTLISQEQKESKEVKWTEYTEKWIMPYCNGHYILTKRFIRQITDNHIHI